MILEQIAKELLRLFEQLRTSNLRIEELEIENKKLYDRIDWLESLLED